VPIDYAVLSELFGPLPLVAPCSRYLKVAGKNGGGGRYI